MEKHVKSDSAAYLKSWLNSLHQDPQFIKTTLMDVKRSASFIGQRLDAVNQRLERDGWEADFSDIRTKNKEFTPMFNSKGERVNPAALQQEPVQEKPIAQEQKEEIAAKNVERPRFHR